MSGGTPLGNMVIKLGLDSSDFGRGAANAKKEVRYLAKEMQANAKIADMAGNQMGKLGTRFDGLTKIIGAQEKQVAALKKAYDESFVDGKATESTKRLATQLQDANGKLANYRSQLIQTAGQMAEMQVKTTGATGAIYNASEKMISSGQKMEKVGGALTKGITLPILAGAAAVTTAAVKWESDFAGVKKTNDEVVDSTGKVVYSYKDLENGLRGLAKELPSSHTEIANVAEAAGQLGIKTKNVVGFTKTMIDLGESTNMSAEEAATALARLANITGMPQTEFDKLGSVIVDLGNNFATTESEITAMGLRLAGAGHQVGMSEAQIMGFAAALSSVGIEAEAGGSAFSKVMVQMQLAVEKGTGAFSELEQIANGAGYTIGEVGQAVLNGGKPLKTMASNLGMNSKALSKMYKEADKSKTSLEDFASVAGMSGEQFSKAFKEDASGAIIKFVEGLGKAEDKGQSAIGVLDSMGITEVRLRDSLLRAAGASDVFKSAVDRGTKAWGQNTALTEEANKRYETTESQLKMLKNEAVDVGITFGGPLVKALRDVLQATKPMIKTVTNLAESFSNADPKTQQTIVKMIALTAAMGPAIKLTGTLTKGVGFLGKGFVETMAAMSKKRAIEDVTKAFAEGSSVSIGFGKDIASSGSALGGLTAKIGGTTTQIGSLTKGFSLLNPWVLGATAAIGTGVAVWKLWGEEAWNSSQRTQRWGTDVGKATDDALTKFQGYSRGASGELDLLEKGISGNTGTIANNFSKMGQSIEENMTKKIETLKDIVNRLPDDIKEAGDKLTQEEVLNQEKYLAVVKENNQKITQIKQEASNNNRKISYEETIRIKSLAKESAEAYVNSLGKSETETKEILSAMTGNVAEASEDQAKTWLQSLGKQRQQSKIEYNKMQDDLKAKLVDAGYDLNSEYAKEMLSLLKESGDSATQITEDQMSTILAKYPELADQVFLANGQLISSMGEAGKAAVGQNKKMMDSFTDMAEKVSKTAGENAKKIELIADEANEFGEFWNQLILDTKTGEVKTNAQEAVNEAASSEKGWNQLIYASKNADLKSNAKLMIAEAAIANGRWEKMTFTEQQALLDSNVTKTMTQALQAKGSWGKLNFEEKKAVLYSNTPEVMAETMLNLGLWKDYQPQVKELKAKNQSFLDVLSQSQDKIVHWSQVPVDIKEILGDNYDLLSKIYGSEQSYNRWKNLPDDEKKLLANNSDVLQKIMTSDTSLKQWNALPADQKKMLGDNTDLLTKVMASEESFNAWKLLPNPVKKMLGNNEDLEAKIADGTISIEEYNGIKPLLKTLLGDSSIVQNASRAAGDQLDIYNRNNPTKKILSGDSSNTQAAARQGGNALNTYNANNPGTKNLRGNAGGVVGAASSGNSSLNIFAANNPVEKLLRANDQASGPASQAKNAVSDFNSGPSVITKTLNVVANLGAGVAKILGLETGTNNHIGGPAIVNDQKGRTYKELVIPKGGVPFIPEGRNVFLPDLPKGSKVIKASETKKLIPHYENGVGVPRNSSVVKNLIAVQDSHESNDFSELASLMREMVSYLKDGNIKNMEVTQYITGADTKTPRETAMETKRQLRDLARGFK
ncbi:phage tail tape measure protein [Enterococcus faecalis]|uniref:phage tail tape measure protein n=1 Tax=Enterococcus faecalis TaxID=1351 RepID=UPI000FF8A7F9|nr:phage tail tape measure protein [Enterococcus faecalis]EGO9266974.1 phage tail tape measure protein [Enterococcus faecalis]EHU8827942.1 phage tail tape measure protein [Enterococcus faecalis]EKK5901981.1 phage tail tape measure protein [Enterococcus faecalis]EME5443141.1 phage tail tape measure protein [Enterococcus faecalis]MCU2259984.1 phage tail tape measure protein [Enterococcus faecalis]